MTPFDPMPNLQAEQRRLIEAIDGNERQLREPRPDSFAALAARRWAFARELLQYSAHEEAAVLRPFVADRRPHVAAEAARLLDEHRRLIGDFKEHVRRWGTFASAEEWPDYLNSARGLMQRVRRCILAAESGLYPHLPVQRGGDPAGAGTPSQPCSARAIGDLIFKGRPLP